MAFDPLNEEVLTFTWSALLSMLGFFLTTLCLSNSLAPSWQLVPSWLSSVLLAA